jgi:hypothetical protein
MSKVNNVRMFVVCYWIACVLLCVLNADPLPVDGMYIKVSEEGEMIKYLCLRGTSQLEGYHAHLNALLKGSNYSPRMADALIKLFNFRFSVTAGVSNRGQPNFGMFNFPLLQAVKDLCIKKEWADPIPQFQPLQYPNTPETFGIKDAPDHMLHPIAAIDDGVVDNENLWGMQEEYLGKLGITKQMPVHELQPVNFDYFLCVLHRHCGRFNWATTTTP